LKAAQARERNRFARLSSCHRFLHSRSQISIHDEFVVGDINVMLSQSQVNDAGLEPILTTIIAVKGCGARMTQSASTPTSSLSAYTGAIQEAMSAPTQFK